MEELNGVVKGVMLMEAGQSPVSTPQRSLQVTPEGIQGDIHAGLTRISGGEEIPNTRQISLVSVDEMDDVAQAMDLPEVKAEWIGSNLLLDGITDLTKLPKGTRLLFPGETILIVEEETLPCSSAGASVQEQYTNKQNLSSLFPKAALGKRGLLAWVERPGEIRVGDRVRVQLPA